MLIKLLIYIKHHLSFIWSFIEWLNGRLFRVFFVRSINYKADELLNNTKHEKYIYRKIKRQDINELHRFLNNQSEKQYRFFKPHDTNLKTIQKLFKNPSFLMMGVYDKNSGDQVGYFFLRMFINKNGFIGRMVDENHPRQGIAKNMNFIIYQTLWQNGFRCLSTISKHNVSILKLHEKYGRLKVLKELTDDYLFVEIVKP